ncbi:MAG TPA: hypothetical protein VI455_19670 [Terriglobia bacterium]
MKHLLTFLFLLILASGQVQCQERSLTTSGLTCVSNGDDYRLLDDGRIVGNGSAAGANDVLLSLPPGSWHRGAKLLGVFDLDAGEDEAMLGWDEPWIPTGLADHGFQVFIGPKGRLARLLREFTLTGGPQVKFSFCRPPKGPDTPKTLIDVQGGAYWGTTYLLMPDGSPAKLFDAASYEFLDLNRNGVYELVAWDWHTPALRCDMSMFGGGPRIYAPGTLLPGDMAYRQVWPVEGGPFQIKGLLATPEGERTTDLVTLTDRQNEDLNSYGPQVLAVYRLASRAQAEPPGRQAPAMQLVTKIEIPPSQIAFYLSSVTGADGERRFVVWYTDRHGCEAAGGNATGNGKFKAVYALRGGRLQQVGTEPLGSKDFEQAGQPLGRN